MKPGIYRLTKDVTNPKPDRRRSRDDLAEATWKAGLRFLFEPGTDTHIERLSYLGDYGSINKNQDGYADLTAALEPEAPSVRTIFEMDHSGHLGGMAARWPIHILQRLVDGGTVSLEAIAAALAADRAEDTNE